ncbi:MAG: DNRLRE domain-containing protein [Candidatus Thiodiazotropha sp. 6PLUC2]
MDSKAMSLLSWMVYVFGFSLLTLSPIQALEHDDQGCLSDDVNFDSGHGCWIHHDLGENRDRPVRVWYYYPENFSTGSNQVIFAMHGANRDATNAIARWQPFADQYGALIIAPEFSRLHYPKAADYNRGRVLNSNGDLLPFSDWTYASIEEIFDQVIRLIPGAPKRYSIQGHSAGGQFVQRMALLTDNFRIKSAVTANPGWYLLPDRNDRYPCGIANFSKHAIDLKTAYARNLVITLGTEDNDPNAPLLNHGSCAEMQGSNRYDRGRFFYEYARKDALNRGLTFNWKLVEVEGVGHSANGMVKAGANEILSEPEKQRPLVLTPTQDATVKANYPNSNYGLRDTLQVDGQSEKTTYIQFDLRGVTEVGAAILRVDVTDPSSGLQLLHEANGNQWSETGLTFSNQPGVADLIATVNGSHSGDLSIDLSDFIHARMGEIVTLVFSSSNANGLYFKSRESTSPPTLELYH